MNLKIQRAAQALSLAQLLPPETHAVAGELPALLRTNGLRSTMCYLCDKSSAHAAIFFGLCNWLFQMDESWFDKAALENRHKKSLLERVCSLSDDQYRVAGQEALLFSIQIALFIKLNPTIETNNGNENQPTTERI